MELGLYYAYEMNLGNLGETFTCKSDTITVHAPHPPSPQPNFVPQRPSLRRRKLNSVNPGSSKFSSTTFLPEVNNHFTFNIYMAQACILRYAVNSFKSGQLTINEKNQISRRLETLGLYSIIIDSKTLSIVLLKLLEGASSFFISIHHVHLCSII